MEKSEKSLRLTQILSKSLVKLTYTIKNIRKLKQHLRNQIVSKFSDAEFHQIWKIISKKLPKEWYSQKIKAQDIIEYVVNAWKADLNSKNSPIHVEKPKISIKELFPMDKLEEMAKNDPQSNLNEPFIIEIVDEDEMPLEKILEDHMIAEEFYEDIIAFTLSDSTTDEFNVVFNKSYHDFPALKGLRGMVDITGELVLGYFNAICTINLESSLKSNQGHIEITSAINGITQNEYTGDKKIGKFHVQRIISQHSLSHLGNSPSSFTKITNVTAEDLDQFYVNPNKEYTRFCHTLRDQWPIPVELKPLAFWGIGMIAATRQGKGYLMSSMLVSIVGQEITTGRNRKKKLGVCYFDYNGQWETDEYGFFQELDEDPRVIIKAQNIGFDSRHDFVEYLFRKYNLFQLGFQKQKFEQIIAYLSNHITLKIIYDDFIGELTAAIQTAYEQSPEKKIEKAINHIENEGGSTLWEKKIKSFADNHNQAYSIVDKALEAGKLVIIDLGDISPPYKPGIVYKVLNHLLTRAKDAFVKNNHEEYVFSTLVILDEAHNYCPEVGKGNNYPYQKKCKSIVKSISADSAKYGLGIGIITQRYAWLSKDILANIRTFFIGPLGATESTNEMVKTILKGKDVSRLRKYQFYALGDAIPCDGEIVKAFSPTEMKEYLQKRGN